MRSPIEDLLPLLYGELRRIADAHMNRERLGHSLQATALVHEAWMRMKGDDENPPEWDRADFLAAASVTMRRILVDHARHRSSQRRGGHHDRENLPEICIADQAGDFDVLALHEALDRLTEVHPRAARVTELKVFGGADTRECALALDVTTRSIDRDWRFARAWLYRELVEDRGGRDGRS